MLASKVGVSASVGRVVADKPHPTTFKAQASPPFRSSVLGRSNRLSGGGLSTLVYSTPDGCSQGRRATFVSAAANPIDRPGVKKEVGVSLSDPSELVASVHDLPPLPIATIAAPVQDDMVQMKENLRNVVGERHPTLLAAADQIFGAGGKRIRPMLVFLIARATQQLAGSSEMVDKQRRLAEITEMIHTASLVHDDVLDECNVRRGASTINSTYGTRTAVLAGDFLFAQSSWYLANLDNLEVIKLISQVIADFANGEIQQMSSLFDCDVTLDQYIEKSFFKTASLIAASCRSAAVFSGMDEDVKQDMYDYGKHLGLAFQIVDDILDFTQSEEQLGKPQGQDLASGNLTCPIIFAMEKDPALRDIIEEEFQEAESLSTALEIVKSSGGLDEAMDLAKLEGQRALDALHRLPEGECKKSLEGMVGYVLERLH
eukprot:CAMPEP_0197846886 /NCGR_PEP_ID=MMETSP1438-20131217/4697_1 /TAXON_ID=1461541 /ORGANISM="Pterosperma sp., Strain CCMP1384" /LENGTH=429 /DNA_ID=CAMNT_0043458667 /DNA_START=86 /DNA_END=1375 /DNA_ORIENTATION=+